MNKRRRNSGQVALILVLVMTVIASAAVALSARTTVETRVQEINVDSSQAMLAAQSGLEQSLKNGVTSGSLDSTNTTTFTAQDTALASNQTVYQGIKRGETVQIFGGGTATMVTLMWRPVGADSTVVPPFTSNSNRGIFVSVVDTSGKIQDYGYDNTGANGFGMADNSVVSGFTYSKDIPLNLSTAYLAVTVLGGDVDLGFVPKVGTLPTQLNQKQVVGIVNRGNESVKYGLNYRQSLQGEVPEVFQYAMFSGQSISQ